MMCQKWNTLAHETSSSHASNVKWFTDLPSSSKQAALEYIEEKADGYFKNRLRRREGGGHENLEMKDDHQQPLPPPPPPKNFSLDKKSAQIKGTDSKGAPVTNCLLLSIQGWPCTGHPSCSPNPCDKVGQLTSCQTHPLDKASGWSSHPSPCKTVLVRIRKCPMC